MTLTIKCIDHKEPNTLDRKSDPVDRVWSAAGDVFIKIARDQPDIQQLVFAVIAVTLKSPHTIEREGFQ